LVLITQAEFGRNHTKEAVLITHSETTAV